MLEIDKEKFRSVLWRPYSSNGLAHLYIAVLGNDRALLYKTPRVGCAVEVRIRSTNRNDHNIIIPEWKEGFGNIGGSVIGVRSNGSSFKCHSSRITSWRPL